MLGDAAGHDALKVRQLRLDIDRQAVEGHPVPHAHADGGNLVLAQRQSQIVPRHPDADPALAALAGHVEAGEGADHPFLQRVNIAAQIGVAPPQIEHGIDDALARPVIGVLAAATGLIDRETVRRQQVVGFCAGAGGIERRMLQQPQQLRGAALADRLHARIHFGQRVGIGDRLVGYPPFGIGDLWDAGDGAVGHGAP